MAYARILKLPSFLNKLPPPKIKLLSQSLICGVRQYIILHINRAGKNHKACIYPFAKNTFDSNKALGQPVNAPHIILLEFTVSSINDNIIITAQLSIYGTTILLTHFLNDLENEITLKKKPESIKKRGICHAYMKRPTISGTDQ